MRRWFALIALLCAVGAVRQAIQGDHGLAAALVVLVFIFGGWSIAMSVSATSSVVDEILDGKDPRTENRKDES